MTVYRNGKAVSSRNDMGLSLAKISARFARNLDKEITDIARRLEDHYNKNVLIPNITNDITEFYQHIIYVTDKLHVPSGRLRKASLQSVEKLDIEIQILKKNISIIKGTQKKYTSVRSDLEQLIDATTHFVLQFRMTYFSFSATNPLRHAGYRKGVMNLPNRPTDQARKTAVFQEVISYQKINKTAKFPPYKVIARIVAQSGISLSARTYQDQKTQIKQGKFHYLIQDRKK